MFQWFRRPPAPDPDRFHDQLRDAFRRVKRDYSEDQRYADFRAVFVTGGATEQQAKRVLWQIFNWGFMYGPLDPADLHKAEGSRWLCLCIQDILKAEPDRGDRPTQTIRDEEDL